MTQVFKPGDVVRLLSGGPKMTVNFVYDMEDGVHCVWLNNDGDLRFGRVALPLLVHDDGILCLECQRLRGIEPILATPADPEDIENHKRFERILAGIKILSAKPGDIVTIETPEDIDDAGKQFLASLFPEGVKFLIMLPGQRIYNSGPSEPAANPLAPWPVTMPKEFPMRTPTPDASAILSGKAGGVMTEADILAMRAHPCAGGSFMVGFNEKNANVEAKEVPPSTSGSERIRIASTEYAAAKERHAKGERDHWFTYQGHRLVISQGMGLDDTLAEMRDAERRSLSA